MRFLVVDDSSTMRRIIINTLNKLGHTEIVEASNGREGKSAPADVATRARWFDPEAFPDPRPTVVRAIFGTHVRLFCDVIVATSTHR